VTREAGAAVSNQIWKAKEKRNTGQNVTEDQNRQIKSNPIIGKKRNLGAERVAKPLPLGKKKRKGG